MSGIRGILLAAGSGQRFGGNKLLYRLPDGQPMGLAAGRRLASVLPDSLAVVRPEDRELAAGLAELGLRPVPNPAAVRGLGSSLAAGIAAAQDADGWLVALGDMPWIEARSYAAVIRALQDGASLAAPLCTGRRGHPVGFHACWRDRLLALDGDEGARGLLAKHREQLRLLPTSDVGVLRDLDRPGDLPQYDGQRRPHRRADSPGKCGT